MSTVCFPHLKVSSTRARRPSVLCARRPQHCRQRRAGVSPAERPLSSLRRVPLLCGRPFVPGGLPAAVSLAPILSLGAVSPWLVPSHRAPGPGLPLGGTQSSHAPAISVTPGGKARQGTPRPQGREKAELLVRPSGQLPGCVLQQAPGLRGRSPAWARGVAAGRSRAPPRWRPPCRAEPCSVPWAERSSAAPRGPQ